MFVVAGNGEQALSANAKGAVAEAVPHDCGCWDEVIARYECLVDHDDRRAWFSSGFVRLSVWMSAGGAFPAAAEIFFPHHVRATHDFEIVRDETKAFALLATGRAELMGDTWRIDETGIRSLSTRCDALAEPDPFDPNVRTRLRALVVDAMLASTAHAHPRENVELLDLERPSRVARRIARDLQWQDFHRRHDDLELYLLETLAAVDAGRAAAVVDKSASACRAVWFRAAAAVRRIHAAQASRISHGHAETLDVAALGELGRGPFRYALVVDDSGYRVIVTGSGYRAGRSMTVAKDERIDVTGICPERWQRKRLR